MDDSPKRKTVDALHAELLGDLATLHKMVEDLKESIPKLTAETKADAAEIVGQVGGAFAEFKQSSVALVAYIKAKQLETMRDLEAAHQEMSKNVRTQLRAFERVQWLIAGLAIGSLFLQAAQLAIALLKT